MSAFGGSDAADTADRLLEAYRRDLHDRVREAIADTLMDLRMDGPWSQPPSELTYQAAMRHYADLVLDAAVDEGKADLGVLWVPKPAYPGWDVPTKSVVSRGAIAWTTAAVLVAVGVVWLVIVQAIVSASRPGPDPTAVPSSLAGPTAGAGDPASSTSGASGGSQGEAPMLAAVGSVLEGGRIAQAKRSHGDDYLAIRADRGTWVRVCGEADCRVMRSTDVGPEAGSDKVADVALVVWRDICGLPDFRGTCDGSIEYPVDAPAPTLPPTDTEGSER